MRCSQCAEKSLQLAFWSAADCHVVISNRRVMCDRERGGVAQDRSVCHRAWSRVERNDHFSLAPYGSIDYLKGNDKMIFR